MKAIINILLMIVCVEAVVFYAFNAAPLQRPRTWVVRWTPFLRAGGDHLLECKICLSFWVGVLFGLLFVLKIDSFIIRWIIYSLVFARVSNWIHLVFSLIQDVQVDIRINRGLRMKEK
jgi:hypothetical protein